MCEIFLHIDRYYTVEIKNCCFDTGIKNGDLYFDYKLKNGICKNINASFLLEKMDIV